MQSVFETHSLISNWSSIGFLGKQAIIHCAFRKFQEYKRLIQSNPSENNPNLYMQRDHQLSLLDDIQDQETKSDSSNGISNTSINLRLLLHLVSIVIHAPFPELPNWVFRQVSGVSWEEDALFTKRWMIQFAPDCRKAILSAGLACALIRDTNPNGFTDAVVLLYSTFVFWTFTDPSMTDLPHLPSGTTSSQHISPNTSVARHSSSLYGEIVEESFQEFFLDRQSSAEDTRRFVDHGAHRMKMRGVGTITTPNGRTKLLEVLTMLMQSRQAWGVSRLYHRIVVKLAATKDQDGRQNEKVSHIEAGDA